MKSKEIQNELWDLFNKGISGGIMCTYADSDGFPVHFINDGMLNYLGYSREEFYKLYEKNTVKLVYKDDVEQVLLKIKEMLPEKKDYEICFRVIKKDGTFIWMVERVRFLNNFEGRKIMLGLFLDITQMMMLQEKLKNQAATLEEQSEELSLQNEELIKQRDMLKNQTHELEISEERFRIALAKISCTIFEYDIEGGKTIRFGTNKNFKESAISMGDAGENIILNGVIDDDYTEDFKKIFQKIKNGSMEESCIIKVLPLNGKEIWDKISLTAIFDKNGSPIRAIGMIEDVTTQKETEIAFKKEEQYRGAILANTLATYIINFNKCIFEGCHINCKSCLVVENGDSYDEAMEKVANYKMSGEHKKAFMSLFASKNVLSEFKNGKNEFKLEYELFEADGKSMWMETTLRLISDLQTGEIKGCLYVTDIEKKKREELKLLRELEIDKLTDVYNKCAAERLISEKLKTPEGIQTGVFMMLDIDRFKNVNDTYGHPFGDKVLIETAKILISSFRNIDIVGRLGGDEFCIFFCGINTKRHLEEMSAVLCDTLRCALSADVAEAITVSIGIATCCGKIKSFEEIYKEADKALYAVKDAGRNGFAFYGDGETNGDAKWIQNSEWILNKMNAGVYICDKESFDLLYANDKLLEIIDMKRSACLWKKCYEVFEGRTSPCESCDMKNMSLDQTFSSVTNFPLVSKQFLLNGKLVNRNKKSVLLGIITDSNDILQ